MLKTKDISLFTQLEDIDGSPVNITTKKQRENRYMTTIEGGFRHGTVHYSTGINKARHAHSQAVRWASKGYPAIWQNTIGT